MSKRRVTHRTGVCRVRITPRWRERKIVLDGEDWSLPELRTDDTGRPPYSRHPLTGPLLTQPPEVPVTPSRTHTQSPISPEWTPSRTKTREKRFIVSLGDQRPRLPLGVRRGDDVVLSLGLRRHTVPRITFRRANRVTKVTSSILGSGLTGRNESRRERGDSL